MTAETKELAEEKLLEIRTSPHIRSPLATSQVMRGVLIALIPASAAAIYFFRIQAALVIVTSMAASMAAEALYQFLLRRPITVGDGSAAVTGLLLALVLPPGLPLYYVALGAAFAIIIGKQIFGGLGYNIFNPALIARAFLLAAFPGRMTTWLEPGTLKLVGSADAVTKATPLALMKFYSESTALRNLFFGNVAGSLGETCALALIIGAAFLLIKGYMDWRIPLSYLGVVFILSALIWKVAPASGSPLFHMLSGGLLLGALFMATDPVTSPITKLGRWCFGIGAGLLVIIIRNWGGLPEGVMYSILLMNAVTPLINRLTRPRPLGAKK
jgi:electron transport complex protein RnfD